MRSFHKLVQGASSVDLVALFGIAAQLTQAEKSSYDRYPATVQESFDKHLDFLSERIMEAVKVSLEGDYGQEDPDEENQEDSPSSA